MRHTARLIPAAYVKPFIKRNKTGARDAEAVCETMQRPSMRFVPIESVEQQAARGLETARDMLVRQRTQLMNAMRGLLELGIVAAHGLGGFAVPRGKAPRRGTAWMRGIMARRPVKIAVVAQAAKTARIAWATLRSGQPYRAAGATA